MDVVTPDMFNKTAAQQLAAQDKPDSLAPDTPQSTAPFITSFSPTASITLTEGSGSGVPTAGSGQQVSAHKDKTDVGAIVGGVVGGVCGLVLIGGLLFWLLRRKSAPPAPAPPPVLYQPEPKPAMSPRPLSATLDASIASNPFTSPASSFAPTPPERYADPMRPYVRTSLPIQCAVSDASVEPRRPDYFPNGRIAQFLYPYVTPYTSAHA